MNDTQNLPPQSSAVFNDISSQPPGNRLVWTYIYTFAYAGVLLFLSLAGADQQVPLAQKRGHVLFYTITIASELVILALAYLGIRISGMRMSQVIAGKWKSVEDFLLDLGLGFGFAIFLLIVVAGIGFALGLNRPGAADQGKKVIMAIAPKTTEELLLFLFLSMAAGVIEEVVFRGFLQIQFGKLARNIWLGMLFSAVLFGLSHAYEGKPRMFIIFVLGALFGTMAILRKSLRTGMIAHALFDGIVGAVAMIAIKSGAFK